VFFELGAYLGSDGVSPESRYVEVFTEDACECFWLDQHLVEVPHEAVADSVSLCFEFDTNGDEGCSSLGLALKGVERTVMN